MKFVQHLLPVSLIAMLSLGAFAAQPETPHNDADVHAKAMEDRLTAIEKRLSDFENKVFGPTDRYFAIPRENMDDMFNRMRREIMSKGDAFTWDEFFGRDKGAINSKPRLGVELAKISDDLKTRFKNDVKQGAFVMSVTPNSPAEKAGLMVGDAITSFDGKAVSGPQDMSDDVKSASGGTHQLMLARHGETKTLKVDLATEAAAAATENAKTTDGLLGWLWNGNSGDQKVKSQIEVHVSALELNDTLAKELKLSEAQHKKMGDILAAQSKALSDDFMKESKAAKGEELSFSKFSGTVQKYTDNAAKELAGVLDAGQLKLWNDYRQAHSSASLAQTITVDDAQGTAAKKFSAK